MLLQIYSCMQNIFLPREESGNQRKNFCFRPIKYIAKLSNVCHYQQGHQHVQNIWPIWICVAGVKYFTTKYSVCQGDNGILVFMYGTFNKTFGSMVLQYFCRNGADSCLFKVASINERNNVIP